jgi:flagellar hook-associated protein 1 FlgK
MSLSGALSNALSGLAVNARGTSVISANIANALNPGYGRREVVLTTDPHASSGGVRIAQIARYADPILLHQRRMATADVSVRSAFASVDAQVERLIGSIDTSASIAGKLTEFEAALFSAASDPSSTTRLRTVATQAESFANGLRSASDGLDRLRTQADHHIAATVDKINTSLARIEDVNSRIMTAKHLGQDTNTLLDQRDAALDQLSEYVPVHVVERDSGKIAVFTSQGRTLLDEKAVELSFDKSPTVLPHMTVDNGRLSALHIDGQPVDIPGSAMMDGGELAAQFELRDVALPKAQARLDAIARDAIERFGPGGPDATIAPGDTGVFTDSGSAFSASDEVGIAGRITLNAALGSESPELWRWRAGVNATSPGDTGRSDLLFGLREEMSVKRVPGSGALDASPQSLVGHIQGFSDDIAVARVRSDDALQVASTRLEDARHATAAEGVNTDQELQKLIELEKSYAANARVVQVVDDMLSELLRI